MKQYKKVIAVLVLLCMLVSLFLGANEHACAKEEVSNQYPLLYANKLVVNGGIQKRSNVEGVDIAAVRNNLLGKVSDDCKEENDYNVGGEVIDISNGIFARGSVSLSGNTIRIHKPIISKGDISISANRVELDSNVFVMSITGNVNFYCNTADLGGVVCAEKRVFFSGNTFVFADGAFANEIAINSGKIVIKQDNCSKLGTQKPNQLIRLEGCFEEDGVLLSCKSSFSVASFDVYGRKAGAKQFVKLSCGNKDDFKIMNDSRGYDDYAVIAYSPYGYSCKSEVFSVTQIDGELFLWEGKDTDNDGVSDGAECWFTMTDPESSDEFAFDEFYVFFYDDETSICWNPVVQRTVFETNSEGKYDYVYNKNGQVIRSRISYRDGNQKTLEYEYDTSGELLALIVEGTRYEIESDGNVERRKVNGYVVKEIVENDHDSVTDYKDGTYTRVNCFADKTCIQVQDDKYTLFYDENGWLSEVQDEKGDAIEKYEYDKSGRVVRIETGLCTIEYSYAYPQYEARYFFGENEKTQRLICDEGGYSKGSIVVLTDGTKGETPASLEKVGKVFKVDNSGRPTDFLIGRREHIIEYDSRGYVISDTVRIDGNQQSEKYLYSYDEVGNILNVCKKSKNATSTTEYYYESDKWSDLLTGFNDSTIDYMLMGLPATYRDGMNISWKCGRPASITTNGNYVEYTYDYRGRRTSKSFNGKKTEYVYESDDLIAEITDAPIFFTYDGNFELIGFEWLNNRYYYRRDIFGDVVAITDENGIDVCSYEYSIWGELLEVQGNEEIATMNPIRYRGYYYDEETGLYYLQNRYYDPVTHRFISHDDMESFFYDLPETSDGLFVYCGNSPCVYVDYDGCQKYTNTIITIGQFESEAKSIAKEIDSYLKDRKHTTKTTVLKYDGPFKSFKEKWNAVNQDSDAKHYIVIDSHGGHDNITGVDTKDVKTLPVLTCEALVLLGCNCGHYDYMYSNIAYEFCKKVTGVVIASDGTVHSSYHWLNPFDTRFTSKKDDAFDGQCINGNRSNKGWLKYRKQYYTINAYDIKITELKLFKATIYELMVK